MNKSEIPLCIRSLKGLEGFVGGRKELAKKLDITNQVIDGWVVRKSIPGRAILKLVEIGAGRFTERDFLSKESEDYRAAQ